MASDYLRQLVEDYDSGRVDLKSTLNRLEFLDWSENKRPLPEDYIKAPRDPLNIFLEKERMTMLRAALTNLRERVSTDTWQVLVFVCKGYTHERIGTIMGISRQAVEKRLQTIRRNAPNLYDLLHKIEIEYEASKIKLRTGYPMDSAKGTSKCRMPEYLAERFGDDKTCCLLCENCKRRK
jgi:hypothetical protein